DPEPYPDLGLRRPGQAEDGYADRCNQVEMQGPLAPPLLFFGTNLSYCSGRCSYCDKLTHLNPGYFKAYRWPDFSLNLLPYPLISVVINYGFWGVVFKILSL